MSTARVPASLEAVIDRAQPLAERFRGAGYRLYFVGGVVRDHLLERTRTEQDLDATTDAHPARIKELVSDLADAVWTQGERFGTIGCTIDGQAYEITTHRAESYDRDSRKPIVTFGNRIEEDLARRDFTVNAMAVDLHTREFVDPHDGRADLAAGVLRTPLDPTISFSEDPLRMLRAARFHAGYSLMPEPAIFAAISSMVDRMQIVSVERIRDEIQKLILLDDPGPGLVLLARTGLLAAVLPSLGAMTESDAEQRGANLAATAPDPAMRWATLFGDDGVAPGALAALRFSGALTRDVVWFMAANDWVAVPGSRESDPPALRRAAALVPRERDLTDLYDWVGALRAVAGRPVDDLAVHRSALAALAVIEPDLGDPRPLLSGQAVCAVLGIDPGPEVGVAMRWLRDLRIEEGPVPADQAASRLVAWWPDHLTQK